MDYDALRGAIIAKYRRYSFFAAVLGVTVQAVSRALNKGIPLSGSTVLTWAEALDIPVEDIGYYFFRRR